MGVSEQHQQVTGPLEAPPTIEELARSQHAEQVTDAEELAADIWGSDQELDEFLADLWMSRDTSTA